MSKQEKDVNVNQEDVKKKALERFQAEQAKVVEDKAVEAELRRLRAENQDKERIANEEKIKAEHAATVRGVRKFHGDTMRKVSARYSADSKPLYVDKGI